MKANKVSKMMITGVCIMVLTTPTLPVFAATWNGVSGVSDGLVNSITTYEKEAASYDSQIGTLTWSINMNQGMIDTWTQYLNYATDPSSPYHEIWKGREAECQRTIDNNRGPMNQRIAERDRLYALKNAALSNAANARAQADAQAATIQAQQNADNNTGGGNNNISGGNTIGGDSSSIGGGGSSTENSQATEDTTDESTNESTNDSQITEPPSSTEDSTIEPLAEDDKDKNDEDKTEDTKPSKPDKPNNEEEAGDIVVGNEDEIKDELNDFDHSKSIEELVINNENGTYTVTEDAMRKAILDKINYYRTLNGLHKVTVSDSLVNYAVAKAEDHKNGYKHWDSEQSNQAELEFLASHPNMLYVTNDLATFQSDFNSRKVDSMEDALKLVDKLAEGIVGEFGGFLSDGHKYDILDPNASLANLVLTSKQEAYIDVWTGQTKYTTVWYLAYVYAATE